VHRPARRRDGVAALKPAWSPLPAWPGSSSAPVTQRRPAVGGSASSRTPTSVRAARPP